MYSSLEHEERRNVVCQGVRSGGFGEIRSRIRNNGTSEGYQTTINIILRHNIERHFYSFESIAEVANEANERAYKLTEKIKQY